MTTGWVPPGPMRVLGASMAGAEAGLGGLDLGMATTGLAPVLAMEAVAESRRGASGGVACMACPFLRWGIGIASVAAVSSVVISMMSLCRRGRGAASARPTAGMAGTEGTRCGAPTGDPVATGGWLRGRGAACGAGVALPGCGVLPIGWPEPGWADEGPWGRS